MTKSKNRSNSCHLVNILQIFVCLVLLNDERDLVRVSGPRVLRLLHPLLEADPLLVAGGLAEGQVQVGQLLTKICIHCCGTKHGDYDFLRREEKRREEKTRED